jgi:hypothetical protein
MEWLLAVVVIVAVGAWVVVARMRTPKGDPRLEAFHREVAAACEAADTASVDGRFVADHLIAATRERRASGGMPR